MHRNNARLIALYSKDHEMLEAYDVYTSCVGKQMVIYEVKDKRHMRAYPTGLIQLPYAGGVMDQPYRLMEYFDIFLAEERSLFFSNT